MQARRIYSTPFVMDRYAKLMFNCNELPREVELTNAFFRRFIIIPFNQTISESEQDPELAKKIINTELSGIFNWVLDGLERLLTNKRFTESTLVKEQIDRYRREADSVAMFIEEEQYKPSLEYEILLKTLYGEYRQFCQENGYKACFTKKLAESLRSLGFIQERKSQGNIIGIKK